MTKLPNVNRSDPYARCSTNNEDPDKVHPVSETIPDSLKLVNDSTIVPNLTPGNGSAGTNDDSAKGAGSLTGNGSVAFHFIYS